MIAPFPSDTQAVNLHPLPQEAAPIPLPSPLLGRCPCLGLCPVPALLSARGHVVVVLAGLGGNEGGFRWKCDTGPRE